ncbi:MAG: universal stress protein [Xanthobacteraceae bacterium]|jgi:nucleotide-binding universal stress UspA family protein
MIKDIVVNLSVTKAGGTAADYAVSVAGALDAHIAGIAFVYDPIVPISGTGYIPAEVIETQQADNEAAAKSAIDRFAEATRRAGLSAEPLTIPASLAGAGDQFGRIARRFDLAVVGQAEPETSTIEDIIAETTLFESGRPMIVVPYIQKAPLKLDNVMVCWDGSRQAARAIGDAMPLLTRAQRVEIVVITNERGKQDEIEGADMGQHLARHGLKVEVHRIAGGNIDVADALLSHAADSGIDFMVMGGYGHSRLREFVLGGVTHTILRSMTVPVLMSH